jgi:hypothetical protein
MYIRARLLRSPCGSTLNRMTTARKGQREGGQWSYLVVLPGVESKATVDHTRLVRLQARGEGESGAYNEHFPKEKRLTPPPHKNSGKTRKSNRHNTLSPFCNLRCAPLIKHDR